MNYRQWKKAYKKKHGVNPPDKRKAKKDLTIGLDILSSAISEVTAQLAEALISAIEMVANQAREIMRRMPTWIQKMPEHQFAEMLAETESAEVRRILLRMRYGGDHDA